MADNIFNKFQSENSHYINFRTTNPIVGTFRSVKQEADPFGKNGENRLVYELELEDKTVKELGSKSKRLAKAFAEEKVEPGDKVRIRQFGSGFDTNYGVEVLEKGGATPAPKRHPETPGDDPNRPDEDPDESSDSTQVDEDGVPVQDDINF